MWRMLRRLRRRTDGFSPGDRVVFVDDGSTAVVHASGAEYSHVYWDDDQPPEDFGGSRVPNAKLRLLEPD